MMRLGAEPVTVQIGPASGEAPYETGLIAGDAATATDTFTKSAAPPLVTPLRGRGDVAERSHFARRAVRSRPTHGGRCARRRYWRSPAPRSPFVCGRRAAGERVEGRRHEVHRHCDCGGPRGPGRRCAIADRRARGVADASAVQCTEEASREPRG